ncbi:MAG TPA: alpha-ketoglutarate-dependent dioxygenase AlkB [Pyrinomonadaceae bacterium]|nr:alpha-ketoglutarate-dependent dioxygenase AlkB [Pyrinomonadaceae bacterium]
MRVQSNLFDVADDELATASQVLEGFRYRSSLIDKAEEDALIARVRELPFREFDFHGFKGKRRVVSFGYHYDFSGQQLRKTEDIPEFLLPLRARAAAFAAMEPDVLQHALVTEYAPGAGIGWHLDKAVFGQVIGVSLLTPCVLRFRRKMEGKWERVNVLAEPRSAYHLSGPARLVWQHSISPMEGLRYSITFRSMRED